MRVHAELSHVFPSLPVIFSLLQTEKEKEDKDSTDKLSTIDRKHGMDRA